MNETYQQIFNDIEKANNILLITHKKPDGDALGSLCAMSLALDNFKKKYTAFVSDIISKNFLFLPNIEKIKDFYGELDDYDLIISLDVGDLSYTNIGAESLEKYGGKIINIDHHFAGNNFGHLNVKIPEASSTAEILANIFRSVKIDIDKPLATCLLTGILTDTHNFSNPATTIDSLKLASDLMLKGAKIQEIVKHCFYNKSFMSVKFLGKVFDKLIKNERYNMVIAVVTLKDLEEVKEVDEDVTEGIANFLNDMSGVDIILVLKEQEKGNIRGSLRTTKENVDVSKLAVLFGGGGHKKAAGFSIPGNIVREGERWRVV